MTHDTNPAIKRGKPPIQLQPCLVQLLSLQLCLFNPVILPFSFDFSTDKAAAVMLGLGEGSDQKRGQVPCEPVWPGPK
jgi:hypothetical protein